MQEVRAAAAESQQETKDGQHVACLAPARKT
ncbi:MAG: hypothetical protein RL406_1277, partial [Pseudomonadota bacterium]